MSDFGYINDSGMRHTELISSIVKLMGCTKYLELGIYDGDNISKVRRYCQFCVGVDFMDKRKVSSGYEFILSTTDDFFKNNIETFDIIFIDADHSFKSVKKDFINSLKILNKFGIILLHDTDPISEKYLDSGYCNDSYKMIEWLEENYPEFNVITLPITEAGLTIINRKIDRRVLNYLK